MSPHRAPAEQRGRSKLRARAASGVFWTATSNWADQFARLLVFVILARLLDPEAFGLVALAWVFIGFTEVIAEQGLVDALVQRKQLDRAHLDTAFWMSLAFSVALALLLAVSAAPISAALDEEALAPVLIVLSVVIPIGGLSVVQRAVLTREMAFRSLALRTMIAVAVGSVVGVGAALLGFGVWSLVAQRISTQVTGLLVLWRVSEWRPSLRFSRARFRELFGFGKHVVGFRLLNFFNANFDNFLIGAVLGPISLGFYTVGYRILRLVNQLTSNLVDKVAFPLYSRLQDDEQRFRRAYYKTTSFAALVAFPAFTSLAIMAPGIVAVLFGDKWSESVPVMQVLSVLGLIRSVNYMNSSTLTALGKPSWRVRIVGVTTVLSSCALLVAVSHGIVAVAIAATCVGVVVTPISYWAVNRLVGIDARTYLGHVKGPLIAAAALAAVLFGLAQLLDGAETPLTLCIALGAGGAAYVVTIRAVARPLSDEARGLLRDALPRLPSPRAARLPGR
jgi:PST family polysaccharide transporter